MKNISIPALVPYYTPGVGDLPGTCPAAQPIIQFKELEVDQARYDEWKSTLGKPLRKKKRSRS